MICMREGLKFSPLHCSVLASNELRRERGAVLYSVQLYPEGIHTLYFRLFWRARGKSKCTEAVENSGSTGSNGFHRGSAGKEDPGKKQSTKACARENANRRLRPLVATASRAGWWPRWQGAAPPHAAPGEAKYRPEKKIARRLPAGAGTLAKIPKGKDFKRTGGKQTDITAYCKAVRGARRRSKTRSRRRAPRSNTTCTCG